MAKTVAIMSENIVTDVIIVDDIEQSQKDLGVTLIEYTLENPALIGWTYDRANNRFIAPENQKPTE